MTNFFFFNRKEKVFFLEDLSRTTKRYNIFPLLEKEMEKKPNVPRNYYEYNLLSQEEDELIQERMNNYPQPESNF